MNYKKKLGQYQKTRVETSGKLDLVILCYEQAVQSLVQAKAYFVDGEYEKKATAMQKALNISNELQCALNFDKGGEIAKNLDALYSYLLKRLLVADIQRDLTVVDEAIQIMSELKTAWEGISAKEDDDPENVSVPGSKDRHRAQVAA